MIMIHTKNYNSTDIRELFDALVEVREKATKAKNSSQIITDLEYVLSFLANQHTEKLKAERNRS